MKCIRTVGGISCVHTILVCFISEMRELVVHIINVFFRLFQVSGDDEVL